MKVVASKLATDAIIWLLSLSPSTLIKERIYGYGERIYGYGSLWAVKDD